MGYVIYYAVFFVILLVFSLTYKAKNNLLPYLVLVWAISAIFAVVMHWLLPDNEPNITLLPFLFLQVCFLISIYPIANFNSRCLTNIRVANPLLLKYLIIFFAVIAIVPFFENLIHVLTVYRGDTNQLSDIYNDKMEVGFDKEKVVNWLSFPGIIGNSVTSKFYFLLPFLLFYYLACKKINKYLMVGLLMAVANPLLFQLSMSGRGNLSYFILDAVFLFLLFRKKIPAKRYKKILISGVVLVFFAVIGLTILSMARKEGSGAEFSDIEMAGFYLGKSHLSFNNDMWHIKQLTEGDNSFSFFKYITGFHTFTDYLERRTFWNESKIGIPPHIFYTYIGDWFMDLGLIGTFILTLIVAWFVKRITCRKYNISLTSLFLFYLYYVIILHGWSYYTFKVFGLTLNSILCLLILFLISSYKNKNYEHKLYSKVWKKN